MRRITVAGRSGGAAVSTPSLERRIPEDLSQSREQSIRVTAILANYAEVAEGSLYLAGGGWSVIAQETVSFAVALIIDLPWNRSSLPVQYALLLRLVNLDGDPVGVQAPTGEELTLLERIVTVDAGQAGAGQRMRLPIAINSPPLPIPPGTYEWRVWIDDVSEPDWSTEFVVAAPAS